MSESKKFKRVCVACDQLADTSSLHKLTLTSDKKLLEDSEFTIPGRSIYIHKDKECLEKALKNKKKCLKKYLKMNNDYLGREIEAIIVRICNS